MANTRRIPFVLNLDDPVDAALWEALEPLLTRHRASQFIRGAVAHALGVGGLLPPVVAPTLAEEKPRPALGAGREYQAKRPTLLASLESELQDGADDADALGEATSNFLNMFG